VLCDHPERVVAIHVLRSIRYLCRDYSLTVKMKKDECLWKTMTKLWRSSVKALPQVGVGGEGSCRVSETLGVRCTYWPVHAM
jgi:hypothetical protein